MLGEESFYPADWLRMAQRDWQRTERLLGTGDPELAGFCLQQAVEKFLKAFLLSKGWRLQRVYDLEVLLNATLAYDPSLESFRAPCQKITAFYLLERYPFLTGSGLTEDDIRISLEQVRGLVEKVRSNITY